MSDCLMSYCVMCWHGYSIVLGHHTSLTLTILEIHKIASVYNTRTPQCSSFILQHSDHK